MTQNLESENLEIEAKFFARDLAAVRQRLLTAGATPTKPRVFERNIRYDNAWDGLARRRAILRVRHDQQTTITYKGSPPTDALIPASDGLSVREEIEITVSDFTTAQLLLERIGFERRQVYEKYRETFSLAHDSGRVEIVLDEMPYGDFVEIEGSGSAIQATADLLQLDWDQRISASYLALLAELNSAAGTDIQDLTFSQFPNQTPSIAMLFD